MTAAENKGVEFPLDDKGTRSTTVINQGAFAASAIDKDIKAKLEAEKKWRFGYYISYLHEK